METKTFIPNQNQQVLGMLAREFGKWNRGRNRILMRASFPASAFQSPAAAGFLQKA